MNTENPAYLNAQIIKNIKPGFIPKVAITLGSGLMGLTKALTNKTEIPYEDLINFPKIEVKGHGNNLILGELNGVPVVFLEGRSHKYEHIHDEYVKTYVRTTRLLGAEYFIATNSSGSLNQHIGPGSLVQISDHINFQGSSPLLGPNDDDFGPRFPPMDDAYCQKFNGIIRDEAKKQGIKLETGVYISVLGPNYETAAEIRMFKQMGADVIGMSTVPEVIVANHCGFKVAVIATITNFATGLEGCVHDHEEVVRIGKQNALALENLIKEVVTQV